ncbi:MAG: F0F1 ATP synthase subunit epsilon [Calditrichaeota bacterium]|nr:MAG: F0F1 ATP synthase subunit epsilon [Calditrichota bacterium]
METPKFQLDIITPFKRVYSGEVESVVAPGFEGYFGVLARHAPLVSAIQIGEIKVETGTSTLHFATSGGFAEVLPKKVTILAEAAEDVTEIDVARAEAARDRARRRLAEGKGVWDIDRARIALARAENRLRLAKKLTQANIR